MSFIRSNTLKLSAMAAATGLALMSTAVYAADPVSADPFNAHIDIVSSSTCGIEVTPAPVNSFQAVLDVNVASGTTHYTTIPAKNAGDMLTTVKSTGGTNCSLNTGLVVTSTPVNSVTANNGSMVNMRLGAGIIPASFKINNATFSDTAGADVTTEWTRKTGLNKRGDVYTPVSLTQQETEATSQTASGSPTNFATASAGTCGTGSGGIACFGYTNANGFGSPGQIASGSDQRVVTANGVYTMYLNPLDQSTAKKAVEAKIGFVGTIGAYPTDLNGTKDLSLVHDGSSGSLQYTVDITLV